MKKLVLLLMVLTFLIPGVAHSEEPLSRYLLQKKEELNQTELKLKSQKEALKELELLVEKKIKLYNNLLASLEKIIKELKKVESEKFLHVVRTYEKMSPEEAALQFEQLDEDMAVKIISKMKERKAAALLARMSPKKAARLIEKVTTIKGLDRLVTKLRKK